MLELAGFVFLGSRLLGQPVVELEAMAQAVPCSGTPLVRSDDIRMVNDAVRRSTQAVLAENGVGGRVATVLYSYEDRLLVRYNVTRALMLQDRATAEEVAKTLEAPRNRMVTRVATLLEYELALDYEAALFVTWDRAWMEIEAGLPRAAQPAVLLGQQVGTPVLGSGSAP